MSSAMIYLFTMPVFYVLIAYILLLKTIKRRNNLIVSIFTGSIFVFMLIFAIWITLNYIETTSIRAKAFHGEYKLINLDRNPCENCKVILYENYKYDIIKNSKIVGKGTWNFRSVIDIPSDFLEIENY